MTTTETLNAKGFTFSKSIRLEDREVVIQVSSASMIDATRLDGALEAEGVSAHALAYAKTGDIYSLLASIDAAMQDSGIEGTCCISECANGEWSDVAVSG